MASKDIYNEGALLLEADPIIRSASFDSDAIDTANANGLAVYVIYGITGDTLSSTNKVDAKVQKSIDSAFTTPVDCATGEVYGSAGDLATNFFADIESNDDDDAVYGCGVKLDADYQYYRVAVTFGGTHTNGIEVAVVALVALKEKPDTALNKSSP